MNSRDSVSRLRKLLIVGAVCFILSWVIPYPLFSAWRDSLRYSQPKPTASAKRSSIYETFSVIWLDDVSSPGPIIDGLWLAYVPTDYAEIELVGLPPAEYREQFSSILKGEPQLLLLPHLRGPLVGSVILDRNDIRELTHAIGGVYLMGQKMDGEGLLNYLASADVTQPDDVLIRQGAVIQSLLAQIAVQGMQIDLARLLDVPSLYTLEKTRLDELVNRYYPLSTEAVRVHPLVGSTATTP